MVHLMARLLNLEASKPRSGADRVLRLLGLGEGEIVADIGAGGGYFAFLFSREVGTAGTVFAVETNSGSLDFIRKQAAKKGLENVRAVPAGEGPLSLPDKGLDLVFLRNVFHHLADPVLYLEGLKKFLKPGGRIAIIDHSPGTRGGFVRTFRHFTPEEDIIQAAGNAGYRLVENHDFLPSQSFLVFEASEK